MEHHMTTFQSTHRKQANDMIEVRPKAAPQAAPQAVGGGQVALSRNIRNSIMP
jgi:hypothetical protein